MIFAALGIFAGLSLNLLLQFALGITSHIRRDEEKTGAVNERQVSGLIPYIQTGCLFLSVIIFWILYYFVLKGLSAGFLDYFLVFPLSSLICCGVERGIGKIFPERINEESFRSFSAFTGYDGLAPVSFILTSRLAVNFPDGFILAFFFALGCLFVSAVVSEISRRAFLERVPEYIKGTPLVLISMGLLSMVFAAAAWICFKLFEYF